MPPEQPPPPITVSVPGRGETPAELLAVGPPAPERPPLRLPLAVRAVGLAALCVLGTGSAVAYERETAPPPPRTLALPATVAGVSATAAAVEAGSTRFVQQLELAVALAPSTGRGDSGGSPVPGEVVLVDVLARGFLARAQEGPFPLRLGDTERLGSGAAEQRAVPLELIVVDCGVDVFAQRSLSLRVRRGDGPVGTVAVASSPDVVRALDRLVSRTCRRPRG